MSDIETRSDSSDEAEPLGLSYHNEIFFKSKFAKGRLKNRQSDVITAPVEEAKKQNTLFITPKIQINEENEHLKKIQQLKEENTILKKNNSNYVLEISQLKMTLHHQNLKQMETMVNFKKTADYMNQLCKYLEDLDGKLKNMENKIEQQEHQTKEVEEMLHSSKIKETEDNSTNAMCDSECTVVQMCRKETLLKSLRRELFSFWVSGKAITNTIKRNLWQSNHSSTASSGFSSLESKFSKD